MMPPLNLCPAGDGGMVAGRAGAPMAGAAKGNFGLDQLDSHDLPRKAGNAVAAGK
jgi:hypothetical protein